MADAQRRCIMDTPAVEQALERMARDILEVAGGTERLALVGIERRGVQLARRISDHIQQLAGARVPAGSLDITLYRDDLMTVGPRPVIGQTILPPGGVDGRQIVIVDDVLYTGRTVRAALDELADFGRPARTMLAVLVDRPGRELPIQADVVGRKVDDVPEGGRVDVLVPELDGRLAVDLVGAAEG